METKYKILLYAYCFVVALNILIVPWNTPSGEIYSFVLQKPMYSSSIDMFDIYKNIFWFTVAFGIVYIVMRLSANRR